MNDTVALAVNMQQHGTHTDYRYISANCSLLEILTTCMYYVYKMMS
jgi:hypothetical protein